MEPAGRSGTKLGDGALLQSLKTERTPRRSTERGAEAQKPATRACELGHHAQQLRNGVRHGARRARSAPGGGSVQIACGSGELNSISSKESRLTALCPRGSKSSAADAIDSGNTDDLLRQQGAAFVDTRACPSSLEARLDGADSDPRR